MNTVRRSSELVRTVRLDDAGLAEILNRLDAEQAQRGECKRTSARYSYRVQGCVVHMKQPGAGSATPFLVPTRNVSETGMAFLHGGFVHTGTTCTVQLITTHGAWENVKATVVRCRHAQGAVHEVGIRFEHPISPGELTASALRFKVLLADDDPLIARLAVFHFGQMNVEVDHVENGRRAVEQALAEDYDIILMDVDMPVMDGLTAVKELRGKRYLGMIVALTARTEPADRERCLKEGCDRYLPKPFERKDLVALVESLKQEPLISDFHNDPSMAELLEAFVTELPSRLRELEEAVASQESSRVLNIARRMKAEGGGYGFGPISTAAAKVESALLKQTPLSSVRKEIDDLVGLCLLARVSTSRAAPPAPQEQSAVEESDS